MRTFTFDGRFLFDPADYLPGGWYVTTFTQPYGPEPRFQQGTFHIEGRFLRNTGDTIALDHGQISHICHLLRRHAEEMDLRQFDIHRRRPDHHRPLDHDSALFREVEARLNANTRGHPAVETVLNQLAQWNPVYRLTREHMRQALELSRAVTDAEIAAWMHEAFGDTWTYDLQPVRKGDAWQTYEEYYEHQRCAYAQPEPAAKRGYAVRDVFAIEDVEGLVWVEAREAGPTLKSASFHGYFTPYREAWLPVTTPVVNQFDRTYVV